MPQLAPAQDDRGPVFFAVYDNGVRVADLLHGDVLRGEATCDLRGTPSAAFVVRSGSSLSIRAVDLAGNVSVNEDSFRAPGSCEVADAAAHDGGGASLREDAGTIGRDAATDVNAARPAASDAATPGDAQTDPQAPKDDDGCSCRVGRPQKAERHAPLWILALAVAFAVRRRRPRVHPNSSSPRAPSLGEGRGLGRDS